MYPFGSRPETVSDAESGRFVWPIVRDAPIKFRDPRLNFSQEIPHKAVRVGIFNRFFT